MRCKRVRDRFPNMATSFLPTLVGSSARIQQSELYTLFTNLASFVFIGITIDSGIVPNEALKEKDADHATRHLPQDSPDCSWETEVHKVAVARVAVRLNDDEVGYHIRAAIEDSKAFGPVIAVHHVGTCQPTGSTSWVVQVQCTSPRPDG